MKQSRVHGSPRATRRVARPFGFLLLAHLPLFAGLAMRSLCAQEEEKVPTPLSDLAQENLNRVAATAAQIEAVLQKQSGLMVELKRWMAQEATNHGQMLTDEDLTDEAIFQRLASDTEFRAAATQVLARYGYLVPKPNPGSEAAQEEEVARQDRIQKLRRQVPEQGHGEETAGAPSERREPVPSQPSGGVRTAAAVLDARPASPSASMTPAVPDESAQAEPRQSGLRNGFTVADTGQSVGAEEVAASKERSAMFEEMGERATTPTASSAPVARADREKKETSGSSAIGMVVPVRQPNPFADIPSLFDMYEQASARSAKSARFGMGIFSNGAGQSGQLPMDLPVGPDYVVGPGDGLAIDLWGGVSQRLYRIVDREGRLTLPEAGPVLVSGRTLAEVQQAVQQILRTQFRDVSADVSLSRLRTIRVYVVGDVERPGAYELSSLSTPLNALFEAGGPTSRGSLRLLKHYRGKQLVQDVDVYDLLLHGVKSDISRLENGDTVLVPPLGPEVTVEGMTRRPAVYEIRSEKTLAEALELAGGILPSAALRHIEVQRLVAHEKRTMLSVDVPDGADSEAVRKQLESFAIQDGDDINIFPIAPYNQDAIYLQGHVLRPGRYSYQAGMKLTDLVSSYKDLLPEPAENYGEIIRLNPPDYHPSVIGFALAAAFSNPSAAPALEPLDTVRIFSRYEFQNPPIVSVGGAVRKPGTYLTPGQIRLSDAVHLAGGLAPDALTTDAQVFRYSPDSTLKIMSVNLKDALDGNPLQNILLEPRDRILIQRNPEVEQPASVYVEGEVGEPGRYPLTTNMTVADLIRIGGGLKRSADSQAGDLMVYGWTNDARLTGKHEAIDIAAALSGDPKANAPLHNGDVLTIRQLPGWNDLGASVTVKGEVKHAGSYGIRPGERLSSILERAGGFEPSAYPYGAILQRVLVRELEAKQRDEMVLRVKDAESNLELLPDTDPKQKRAKEAALAQYQTTLTQLNANPPTGRVNIRISSNLKGWKNTPADIEVRAGDTLTIPKRPDYVMVTGQVFNPTAVSFRAGKNAKWYLSQSGGPATLADKKSIFVIRADGSVVSETRSLWGGESLSATLQPGDTVVVPERALGGGANWQNLFTSAQLASSIASTVFIALRY